MKGHYEEEIRGLRTKYDETVKELTRQIVDLKSELTDTQNETAKMKQKLQASDIENLDLQRRYFELLRANFISSSVREKSS